MEQFKFGVVRLGEEKPFIIFTKYEHAYDFANTNRNNGVFTIVELVDNKWTICIPFSNR